MARRRAQEVPPGHRRCRYCLKVVAEEPDRRLKRHKATNARGECRGYVLEQIDGPPKQEPQKQRLTVAQAAAQAMDRPRMVQGSIEAWRCMRAAYDAEHWYLGHEIECAICFAVGLAPGPQACFASERKHPWWTGICRDCWWDKADLEKQDRIIAVTDRLGYIRQSFRPWR